MEQANAFAQIGAVVRDDLLWHADAPSQILQALLDVNAGAVGRDAEIEDHDLMMLQGTRVGAEVVQRCAQDEQTFLRADADGGVEDPHPVVAARHRAAKQEQATSQQPGANRLVVGEAQRQGLAKDTDETEQDFAGTAQTDVGVEIPKQAEANDQQRVPVPFRCRELSKLSAARALLRWPCRRTLLARLFELGTQSGELLRLLPRDSLPVIAACTQIADGDAKFLHRPLLVGGTLLPEVPAAAKQPPLWLRSRRGTGRLFRESRARAGYRP